MRRVKFKIVRMIDRGSVFADGDYALKFPKGAIVKAREDTLGVAVFRTRKQAEGFLRKNLYFQRCFKVIHVRPIGRGRTVKYICVNPCEFDLNIFYLMGRNGVIIESSISPRLRVPPLGTIFYPAVEVLD